MKNAHLLLPDLFLPAAFAAAASADLDLPVLGKLLARSRCESLAERGVEQALCAAFGMGGQLPVAAISARHDGLPARHYLRADPVHLRLQRDQMVLSQVEVTAAEAAEFCAALNDYFAGQDMVFHAPHPLRWYVELARLPDLHTTALSEVTGGNVRGALPSGADAPHWNQVFNEIQMLLFAHPLNAAREARGVLPVNSLWFWGGGAVPEVAAGAGCDAVASDDVLGEMFAAFAGLAHRSFPWQPEGDRQLLVCTRLSRCLQAGDLQAWRTALQQLERELFQPLYRAVREGRVERLQLDVLAGECSRRYTLARADTWRAWRRGKPLAQYSLM